jgi:hypothetical protein
LSDLHGAQRARFSEIIMCDYAAFLIDPDGNNVETVCA